jgi:23S rRNA (cytidine1920-2'-O)/16S rRNA (cytidine1409-2'-O)-methyltransferase
LDVEMVRRGLVGSRAQAERLVSKRLVLVGGAPASKCSRLVAADEPVTVLEPAARYVSRGGEKLAHALAMLAVPVRGICVDIGASTGGFTDCLLQHGADRVVAVDSGHGQLDRRLRSDGRVELLERTNARDLLSRRPDLRSAASLVTADVSFISLTVLAAVLVDCADPGGGELLLMVKPQFEVDRVAATRGRGVVRSDDLRRAAVRRVAGALVEAAVTVAAVVASPLLGPAGNAEFFLYGRRTSGAGPGAGGTSDERIATMIDAALAAAPDRPGGRP